MKFMYVGDDDETKIFGLTFKRGEEVEVTDAHAVKKLKASALFMHNDEPAKEPEPPAEEPKRRGRQAKVSDAPNQG